MGPYNQEDEKRLISGIMKREDNAYEVLIERYGQRLLKVCFLILKEKSLAEDAVQETFIQIYKSIHKFNYKASLYTWIYRIAINKCRDLLRKCQEDCLLLQDVAVSSEINLEEEILSQIKRDSVKEIVMRLPARYREIIILFYFEELTVKEISNILEEKENTVKSKLLRGRSLLRESLIKEGVTYEG